ncbi:Hypothetical_protein [Hexamita inflata]|uniref:Hypothetical_protein n=1 Tax=Hexamita inflata TaxID=28002 RepID=A0AA86PF36_9EUKA|nr:Hypothetical protein HINF_LOCUS25431 [Hexamita inflata]
MNEPLTIHNYLSGMTVTETENRLIRLVFVSYDLLLKTLAEFSIVKSIHAHSYRCIFNNYDNKPKRVQTTLLCSRTSGSASFLARVYLREQKKFQSRFLYIVDKEKLYYFNKQSVKYYKPETRLYFITFHGQHHLEGEGRLCKKENILPRKCMTQVQRNVVDKFVFELMPKTQFVW